MSREIKQLFMHDILGVDGGTLYYLILTLDRLGIVGPNDEAFRDWILGCTDVGK